MTTESTRLRNGTTNLTQLVAGVVGAVFALVGVAGFVPGLTPNLDSIEWAGRTSDAELLGVFQVSVLHNLVHLAFGVLGLASLRSFVWAKSFLIWGGAVYLALAFYGVVIDLGGDANFVPVNTADNWLHVVLGTAMVVLGLVTTMVGGSRRRTAN